MIYDKFVVQILIRHLDLRVVDKLYTAKIKRFGRKVKEFRLIQSLSQQELAYRCGVDIRTIQRIEKGEYGLNLHVLFALGEALDIKAYELIRLADEA